MTTKNCRPGIDILLRDHLNWLNGQRFALVAHVASLTGDGTPTPLAMVESTPGEMVALMSPEHGFHSTAGAGDHVDHSHHPEIDLPIHSLYGKTRRPSPRMLEGVDTLVFDLQDLGFRCYTYTSTLREVLEAANDHGQRVIVCDRPAALPNAVDGPMLQGRFESFVGEVPTPLSYGMTPGELARFIVRELELEVDLHVAPMEEYKRLPGHELKGIPWEPPSPAIRSWECAYAYLTTVFTEALPQFACARKSIRAFQELTGPGIDGKALAEALNAKALSGVLCEPQSDGILIHVHQPREVQPVSFSVHLLHALGEQLGREEVWNAKEVRPDFFDQLYGTNTVRQALMDGDEPEEIIAGWELEPFMSFRQEFLRYK